MAKKRKGSGEKLFRTKAVGVRLDPKLKYAAELAARKQRRTLSSFIEWAIQEAVNEVQVTKQHTAGEAINDVWDVFEADRFVMTAANLRELLTHDEEVMWKLMEEHDAMWRGGKRDLGNLRYDLLREHFETFKKVAKGELDEKVLEKIKPKTKT